MVLTAECKHVRFLQKKPSQMNVKPSQTYFQNFLAFSQTHSRGESCEESTIILVHLHIHLFFFGQAEHCCRFPKKNNKITNWLCGQKFTLKMTVKLTITIKKRHLWLCLKSPQTRLDLLQSYRKPAA